MATTFNDTYEIRSVIGKGGMSTVYLAEHKRLHTRWAVKEVRKEQGARFDFLAESNILKRLQHPMYNRYLVSALEYHWETKMLLYRCTAMERYRWFLSRYPGLIDSISNKHIASFLGMTPVTLSRLRRQLRSQADGGEEAPGEAAKTE